MCGSLHGSVVSLGLAAVENVVRKGILDDTVTPPAGDDGWLFTWGQWMIIYPGTMDDNFP